MPRATPRLAWRVFDQEAIVARVQGRAGWLREAKRQLDDHRQSHPRPVPRDRLGRLLACEQRLVEDLAVEREANQAYEAYRARGVMKNGRRFGGPPKAYCRRPSRSGRSTRATLTPRTSRRFGATCRAITPRRW